MSIRSAWTRQRKQLVGFTVVAALGLAISLVYIGGEPSTHKVKYVPYALGGELINPPLGSGIALVTPPEIGPSLGFNLGSNWEMVSSAPTSLYVAPSPPSSPNIPSGAISPASIGLTGGVSEIWVLNSAVQEYGAFGSGLPLPLPQSFAASNPGPNEVLLTAFQFSANAAAAGLYNTPGFSNAIGQHADLTPVPGLLTSLANVSQYSNPEQAPQSEYIFQWATSNYWVNLVVIGSTSMTLAQAESVASNVSSSELAQGTSDSSSQSVAPSQIPWPGQS